MSNPIQQIFKVFEHPKTPNSFASQSKRFEARQNLISILDQVPDGGIVVIRDSNGNTVLHSAISRNLGDIIPWLMRRYPDLVSSKGVKNGAGLTPLALAEQKDNYDLARFLRESASHHVSERAIEFVTQFANRLLTKMESYGEDVLSAEGSDGGPKTSKRKSAVKIFSTVTSVGQEVLPEKASNMLNMISKAHDHLLFGKMKKVANLMKALGFIENDPDNSAKFQELVVRTGFEIFSCFEQHLVENFTWAEWRDQQSALAQQCADRFFIYVDENLSEDGATLNPTDLSRFFMHGKPHAVSYLVKEDKWGEVIKKSGAVILAEESKYLIKQDSMPDRFGFRKLFKYEESRKQGQNLLDFNVSVPTPWNVYNFVMNEEEIERGVQKVQQILQGQD